MSSCVSHLRQARLSLAHGLILIMEKESSPHLVAKHLKPIQSGLDSLRSLKIFNITEKEKINLWDSPVNSFSHSLSDLYVTSPSPVRREEFGKEFLMEDGKAKIFSGKERIVHEAVKEMKSIGLWVCGIFLSCFYGDAKPYMEMRKFGGGFDSSSVIATLDFKISEQLMGKRPIFSEIKEINYAVAELLVASEEEKHDSTKELQRNLHLFEKLIDEISKEVNNLFVKVMTQRSELIDGFRI